MTVAGIKIKLPPFLAFVHMIAFFWEIRSIYDLNKTLYVQVKILYNLIVDAQHNELLYLFYRNAFMNLTSLR